jgi:hypothetical protein
MKLELKSVKHAKFASQETPCYEATLYLDGKKVAHVSNDGHGGCDRVFWADRSAEGRIDAHFAAMPKIDADGITLQHSLELWCHEEIERQDILKTVKRRTKTKVIGLCGSREFSFNMAPVDLERTYANGLTGRQIIEKDYPDLVLLNGLDDDAIVAAVRKASDAAAAEEAKTRGW